MTTVEEILKLPNGARFFRADLHIHSIGASHDVSDAGMTAKAIIKTALSEHLDLIAITDHNEISNVEVALTAASGTPLIIVPGVELSTPQGHLLCYLPSLQELQKFYGRLDIADRGKNTSHCQQSMLDCLNLLEGLGGFGILAHVDGPGGLEVQMHGSSPHKLNIVCHQSLRGIELKTATSDISYSPSDPDKNRVAIGAERTRRLGLGSRQFLARLLNSDAHSLKALGRNAQGDRKVSRIKMDRPGFDALRIALDDADARIRIEDQIPATVPSVVGLTADGGFLNGLKVHLSPNLNCIIGGRGTGKSTTFEGIRCLINDAPVADVVDSEIWPDELELFWLDEAEQIHPLSRLREGDVRHVDDPVDGPTSFKIESYGQGETASISKEANENPVALLSYLDRFIDVEAFKREENVARDEILDLHTKIEEARKNVDKIEACERDLTIKQQQLAALEKVKAKDVIELQRKLEEERSVRTEISEKLTDIEQNLEELDPSIQIDAIASLADPNTLVVGTAEFKEIVAKAKVFETAVKGAKDKAASSFETFQKAANDQLVAWKAKESATLRTIEAKKKELEAKNIRLDMAYIQKLARDEARLKAELKSLKAWLPRLKDFERQFAKATQRRWAARSRIVAARMGHAKQASDTLRSVLGDLLVTLKFLPSAHSQTAEEQIIAAMGWKTSQVPRAALLIQQLTLPGLITAIEKKDTTSIARVVTEEGVQVLPTAEIARLISALSEPAVRFALERAEVFDLPKLTVTGAVVARAGSKPQYVTRDFTKLSIGQQQSVLLALMLSSKSNAPLIIDQPEDNLDSEFIYRTLVPVLRLAKERRQIIVVTHNANIAVLGDAEQIIVLKSTNERGSVVCSGSIDDPTTRDAACAVLEGAKEAFQRRARIYGIA